MDTGKSHLAQALGHCAVRQKVLFQLPVRGAIAPNMVGSITAVSDNQKILSVSLRSVAGIMYLSQIYLARINFGFIRFFTCTWPLMTANDSKNSTVTSFVSASDKVLRKLLSVSLDLHNS